MVGFFASLTSTARFAIGNAADMRAMAETLDKLAGSIEETYIAKTGATEQQVRAWMAEETWFNAEEAEEAGFVDEVTEAAEIKAAIDLSRFHNVPSALSRPTPEPAVEPDPGPAAAGGTSGTEAGSCAAT